MIGFVIGVLIGAGCGIGIGAMLNAQSDNELLEEFYIESEKLRNERDKALERLQAIERANDEVI